ncbi:MAG: tetratricopeptide repeat protein [Sphingobacteriaceae bacterium]|nr:tetratricopeptide repeat protein [Sphingobacteriaceae bacterium]
MKNYYYLILVGLLFSQFSLKSQLDLIPDSIAGKLDTMSNKRADALMISKAWGFMSMNQGEAMKYAKAHYELGLKRKDSLLLANANVTKGTIYQIVGDYPKSINELISAVKIYGKLNDSLRLAVALNNLGNTYRFVDDFEKAIECQNKAMIIRIAKKDSARIRGSYMNIAAIEFNKHNFSAAIALMQKSFLYPSKDKSERFRAYINYAGILGEAHQFDTAFYYLTLSEKLIDDSVKWVTHQNTLGGLLLLRGDFIKAEKHLLNALNYYERSEDLNSLSELYGQLSKLYKDSRNFDKALRFNELYHATTDSLNNNQKNLQVAFLNAEFDLGQKEAEIHTLQQKSVLDEKEKSNIRIVRNSVIVGIILTLLLVVISYRKSIERKKLLEEIAQKNSEITDSINYAKHIQKSFLPSEEKVKSSFLSSFILYQPKDIVAGDFYWLEENENNIWFALADCTGHGVPGALVSVVCCNALNRAIGEFGLEKPGEILDQARKIVVKRFSSNNNAVKDGMDITLIRIEKKYRNAEVKKIQYAGANNSLYLYTNGEIQKIPANKQPIGYVENPIPFGTKEIKITKNDTLYLFTDGYADQFGGQNGKKFKYKQLLKLIQEIAEKPLNEQNDILLKTFKNWQGSLEQVDDICLAGVKI